MPQTSRVDKLWTKLEDLPANAMVMYRLSVLCAHLIGAVFVIVLSGIGKNAG